MYAYSQLEQFIYSQIPAGLVWQSRIQPITRYADLPSGALLQMKREDEMGMISGSKTRKYASLQPYFRRNGFDTLVAAGGEHSNNLMGLTLLAREMNMGIHFVVPESHQSQLKGNMLWRQLCMVPSQDRLHTLPRSEYPPSSDYVFTLLNTIEAQGLNPVYLPEGCAMIEAIPGAMTLCLDVVRNCMENDTEFEHIFIDSGTGLQAISFLSGLAELWPYIVLPKVYVTLIAGTEAEFRHKAEILANAFDEKYHHKINPMQNHITFIYPPTAVSFGQVNKTILNQVRKMATTEGILLDPIYGIKHAMATVNEINKRQLKGNILMINSGNAIGLTGFQEQLKELL